MIYSIVAKDTRDGIGWNNGIPWKIKEDLERFKDKTTHNIVLMGRKTYDSIGKPLPNRINVVITHNKDFNPKNVMVFDSIEKALKWYKAFARKMDLYIIGGEQIYRATLDVVDKIIATVVIGEFRTDTLFPQLNPNMWRETDKSIILKEGTNEFYYVTFIRK